MSFLQAFDPNKIREAFPVLSRTNRGKPLIYLDNAATSQKPQCVIDAISSYYSRSNSNVHRGVYELAEDAENLYLSARSEIANWLGVNIDEIIFTRGATECLNLIANSFAEPILAKGDQIILTEMEHHANIVPWQIVSQKTGSEVLVSPILDDGSLDREKLSQLIAHPQAKILSLCHISNVLGTINPIKEIITEAHANGVKVLIDGAQSVPHLKVDLKDLDCDFFVFSGHKLFAPMGIGVVYAKKEHIHEMVPYQGGGDMIDQVSFSGTTYTEGSQRFEAGTPNVCGAIGLGEAVRFLQTFDFSQVYAHERKLLEFTREQLIDTPRLIEHGTTSDKAGVFCFSIDGIHPHDLATLLDAEGIATRTGHHCCQPLMARLGHTATARASYSIYNTKEEVEQFTYSLLKAVKLLR
ncbi:MAG: SufS family cysteine desulfurase [Opitutae bacterium]